MAGWEEVGGAEMAGHRAVAEALAREHDLDPDELVVLPGGSVHLTMGGLMKLARARRRPVVVEYPDGSDAVQMIDQALHDIEEAMREDLREGRWGRIRELERDGGAEVPLFGFIRAHP